MIDKSKPIVVEVTQEDIDKGVPGDPSYDFLGLALRRTFPGCFPMVDENAVTISIGDDDTEFALTNEAQGLVKRFDHYCVIEPCALTIYRPN